LVLTIAIVKFAGPCVFKKPPADDTAKPVNAVQEKGKKAPDFIMTVDDVRRLVRENEISVNAAEQRAVVNTEVITRGRSWWGERDRDAGEDSLTLWLSVDTSLQKYAASMFRQYRPRYAAAAAIDPATGRVLALASYAAPGEPVDGSDLYLRGIFPAASVFKTVVAAAGIERGGMHANTAIQHYGRRHTLYKSQLKKDLKTFDDITLQDAFAYSVNPAFARIALFNVNKDIVTDYGRRFGFNDSIPFEFAADVSEMFSPDSDFSVAEFASGFNRKTSISPLFGALLAGAVCEGGVIREPTVVDSVWSSARGACVYRRGTRIWRRAVKESTASELRGLMTKVTEYGTARKTFRPLRESRKYNMYEFGGKTGSVNKLGLGRVDWFVGFARHPNDKNKRIAVGVVTTHGDYWTVHSSYIAAELFKKYISNQSL
jgi:cell division protein FtsI/penicillin-binding protein 2